MNIERNNKLWLPRTGQTISYAAGDDGYFQAGNPRKTRFIDNGNGTISDRATGLTWVKEPAALGAPFNAKATWANALSNIATLNAGAGVGGKNDWRLPNIIELVTAVRWIVGDDCSWPPFVLVKAATADYYWGATTYPGSTIYASVIRFYRAAPGLQLKNDAAAYVLPVRGGRINANW